MQYVPEFLTVAIIHLIAVMSPGPDFVMITRNSLIYSRRVGIYSAIGLAMGIAVHITYSLVGIGFIISQSIVLFSIIKYLGAGYLIYIGIKALQAKKQTLEAVNFTNGKEVSKGGAIKMGFLTNVLNPKASLFFLALFTQVIHQTTPAFIKLLYGAEMSAMTFIWFGFVALILSHGTIKKKFAVIQHHAEHFFGIVLIALGIKVALSSSK